MLSSEPPVFQQNLVRKHSARNSSPPGNGYNAERDDEVRRSPQRGSGKFHGKEGLRLKLPRQTQVLPPVEVTSPVKKTKGLTREGQLRFGHSSLKNYSYRKESFNSGSGNWHTASCKLPSTRYSIGESDYNPDPNIPTIQVSGDRRTSISSQLRFSRTFSTDSLDSLERQCLKEFRRQRLFMDETEEQKRKDKVMPPTSLLSPTSSNYPLLRSVGRSKTDPGGSESESTTPVGKVPIGGLSFDSSKLGVSMDGNGLKRSAPDLCVESLKPRTLKDVIGISSYQAKGLLQCWPNIYATGTSGSFAGQLYSNLCSKNPKAKTILQKADGVAVFSQSGADCTSLHVKMTLELIDTIIRSLDSNPTNVITYLTEIGQRHRTLKDEGMSTAMWDDFGDAILDGVRKNDLVRRHKELRRAWLAIIAFITDNIKQGHSSFRASPSSNDIGEQRTKKENES